MLKMAQACNTLGSEWVSWFIESAEMQAVIMAQMQRLRIEAATLRRPMPHSLLLHDSEIQMSLHDFRCRFTTQKFRCRPEKR